MVGTSLPFAVQEARSLCPPLAQLTPFQATLVGIPATTAVKSGRRDATSSAASAPLDAPITATRHALAKAGMTVQDIDLFECNEAFASVPMAWMQELDIPLDKVNVRGGAMALGHPLGATGARLMTTLLHALEDTGGRYGLQTMCEGGGQANVTIVERL